MGRHSGVESSQSERAGPFNRQQLCLQACPCLGGCSVLAGRVGGGRLGAPAAAGSRGLAAGGSGSPRGGPGAGRGAGGASRPGADAGCVQSSP